MTLPRPQDLNAPILRLVLEGGSLAASDIDRLLAFAVSLENGNQRAGEPIDAWRFSLIAILARKRLLRYGFLRMDCANRLAITPRGEIFLARGLTKVNARSRQVVDSAVLDSIEAAFRRSA